MNFTKVSVTPAKAITTDGLVKLSYTQVEDKERLEKISLEEKERITQELVQNKIAHLQETLKRAAAITKAQEELQSGHLKAFIPPEEPPEEAKKIDNNALKKSLAKKNKKKKGKNQKQPKQPKISKAQLMAQAKDLLQQKQGVNIDTYFYNMNKTYRDKQAFFVISDRYIEPKENTDSTFTLTCYAKASTGITETSLNDSRFSCGTWLVDLSAQSVTPYDNKAIQIFNQQP